MSIEQAQEQSVMERLAAQFEPEQPEAEQPRVEAPEEQAETEDQEASPEVVDVEFGGKSYQVPPELKDALMAQSDYTKKTSEVAEQRRLVEVRAAQIKAAESERAFESSVKDEILGMQEIDFQIKQYKSVDVTGMSSEQLWQLNRHIEGLKEQRNETSQKVTDKYNQWKLERDGLIADMQSKAKEAASKAVPNWSEDTQKQIREYASSQGFEAQELNNITDPRVVKVLWQASQFAKLQQAKVSGKVTTVPSVKPGSSNPMPQAVKDKFAHNKAMKSAPNSAARAKVIEAELMRRF